MCIRDRVGVFGEGVVLPAASLVDDAAAPDACGAVEVKEEAGAGARAVLEDEVAVEEDGFDLGEEAVVAVEVSPAGLHHADSRLGEVVDGAQEPIGAGDEVGVEDGDEFAGGGFEAFLECAGFESAAVGPVQVNDVVAESAVAVDDELGDLLGFVGGVVEGLDFEQVAGVFEAAGGVNEAIDNELLVVDGEPVSYTHLDVYKRQALCMTATTSGGAFLPSKSALKASSLSCSDM